MPSVYFPPCDLMVSDGSAALASDIGPVALSSTNLRSLVLPIPDRLDLLLSLQRQQSRIESEGHRETAQEL